MTTITCKIPETLDAKLEAAATARKVSKSHLVRECLEQALPKKKGRRVSLYDRMQEACGMVKSGVRDLASNPRHMEGFGED